MNSNGGQILIFANPISGLGKGVRIAGNVAAEAVRTGWAVTQYLDHPATAPDELIPRGPDGIVVVIGGDGTLRSVADRLLKSTATADELPLIVPVPLGTANLVATHLGAHWDHDKAGSQIIAAISAGRRRKFDIARANGKAMLAISGIGFDAQVVHELSARRCGPITYANYVVPIMQSIAGYGFHPISVTIDNRCVLNNQAAIAFVGNIAEYGAGFAVTPTACSNDGLLDICVLPCRSWQELFELGCMCGAGIHMSSERVIYQRGKHVEVASHHPVPVQIDGDESGFTPLTIDLLPQQLTFIVP